MGIALFLLAVLAVLVLLPTAGLVTWAWFAMAEVDQDLRSISSFEAMSFDL